MLLANVIAEGKAIKSDTLTLQEDRIKDLQRQIEDLHEQTKGKDEQLKVKDTQIEKLNENMHELTETMHAQSVHIQTLLSQHKQIPVPEYFVENRLVIKGLLLIGFLKIFVHGGLFYNFEIIVKH